MSEKAFEQNKFNEVRDFLNSEIERLFALIVLNKEEIKTQGRDFNADNPNGGMYSGVELTQIHYDMEKKMVDSKIAEDDIYFYKKLIRSPYFARVDFKPDNASKSRSVYIGLRTLQDPKTFKTYVCDWRAPISSLFYDEFEDKAYFEAPSGTIKGDLLLKRQYKFLNGELDSFINCDIKIDDDILRDVLSSSSGDSLKVIVNSIQREQNNAVRYSDKENLIVIGPAGSGKTSVGFHRLAFLLYRNRTELTSSEIVMFSNNDIFSSYVADIIPELGEMPINYASFRGIFKAEISDYAVEDYYALAEDVLKGDKDKLFSTKEKSSTEFMKYLDESVKSFVPEFDDISFYGFNIISKDDILSRYNACEGAPATRGEVVAKYIDSLITNIFDDNKDEISARIIDENSSEDELRIVKKELREFRQSVSQSIKDATIPDGVDVYFDVLREYAEEKNMPYLLNSEKTKENGIIEFQDALGIVYLKTAYRSSAVLSGVKHILIDEAQDYSLIQHEIIKRMFPRAKFTILADTNQAIIEDVNICDENVLAKIYGAQIRKLNKSYRSTKEINEYALNLLPEEKRYDIFRRDGEPVEETKGEMSLLKEKVKSSVCENRTVCVLTKTEEDAKTVYNFINNEIDGVSLCVNNSGSVAASVCVMPLAYSKGLEFDTVFVADINGSFKGEENKKNLYLASTRALHKLCVFTITK